MQGRYERRHEGRRSRAQGHGRCSLRLAQIQKTKSLRAGTFSAEHGALGTILGALPGPLEQIGQIAEALGKMIKDTEQAAEGYRKSARPLVQCQFLSGFKAADDVRVSSEAVDSALVRTRRAA